MINLRKYGHLLLIFLSILVTPLKALSAPENEKTVKFSNSIKVISRTIDFDATAHKVTLCNGGISEPSGEISYWACVIDGTPTFGVGTTEPADKIESIEVIIGKHKIKVDTTGMYYGPGAFIIKKEDSNHYQLRGCFADGILSYTATWEIIKEYSVRTSIKELDESSGMCDKAK